MDAEVTRRSGADRTALESDPALGSLIRDEIARVGPITFARFMELALYAPGVGYYTSDATRIGRAGDFLTAPETHPIFGQAIARQAADVWRRCNRPRDFAIREYGAGSGALAQAVVAALVADEPEMAGSFRYEAIEINPHRRDELVARLARTAPAVPFAALDPAAATRLTQVAAGFVLANEFLDAFPVHRVEQTAEGLREGFVDWAGGGFVERFGPPSMPALAERLASEDIQLRPGQRAEIALGLDDWFGALGSWLGSGVVIVIDYGYPAAELYGPRRLAGTVLGYVDHRPSDDPLVAVGRQDLTAHVDFTAVEAAASAAGFTHAGHETQAQFLLALGLEELLERARSDPAQSLGQYLELRSGVVRLLDPRHTGGFGVLAFSRGLDPTEVLAGMRRSRG